jgi:hypothetical protein
MAIEVLENAIKVLQGKETIELSIDQLLGQDSFIFNFVNGREGIFKVYEFEKNGIIYIYFGHWDLFIEGNDIYGYSEMLYIVIYKENNEYLIKDYHFIV